MLVGLSSIANGDGRWFRSAATAAAHGAGTSVANAATVAWFSARGAVCVAMEDHRRREGVLLESSQRSYSFVYKPWFAYLSSPVVAKVSAAKCRQ